MVKRLRAWPSHSLGGGWPCHFWSRRKLALVALVFLVLKRGGLAGQDNKWVAGTKREEPRSVEWQEGCGQWQHDCSALADVGVARYFPFWISSLFC